MVHVQMEEYFRGAKRYWSFVKNMDELARFNHKSLTSKVLGLFNHDHMSYEKKEEKKDTVEPSLTEMVSFGMKFLRIMKKVIFY